MTQELQFIATARESLFVWILLVMLVVTFVVPAGRFPGGLRMPALAIELVDSPAEAQSVIEQAEASKPGKLKAGIRLDWFIICFYWATFLGLSLALLFGSSRVSAGWAAAAGGCATAAALFDILENRFVLRLLQETPITQTTLTGVQRATLWKWGLLFIALAFFARVLLHEEGLAKVLGHVFLAAAALGGLGFFWRRLIEASFVLICVGLFLGVWFLVAWLRQL